MKFTKCMAIASVAMASFAAQASTTVFSDTFESASLALNTIPAGWAVADGTVDVVTTGTYGLTCAGGAGRCVDLDGSTMNPGVLSRTFASVAGMTYTLSFDLSGNQRTAASDTVSVMFGSTTASFTVAKNDPWLQRQVSYTALQGGQVTLSFANSGADNQGAMLDNVSVTAVPEPESYALMLAGLGLMGTIVRRRKQAV